jgi:NhaP-type Na+/H+ or K+/H+ antiporter
MNDNSESTNSEIRLPSWYLPTMIAIAIGAAIVSEFCTNANKERYFTPTGLPPFPPELLRKVMWDNIYNHSICYGFLGAVICGLLAMITGGLAGPGRAVVGFVVGSALGLVGGVLTGVAGHFVTQRLQEMEVESILAAMIIFAPVWGILGLITTVLSLMLVKRRGLIAHAVMMTLVATLCAILLYPLVVTLAFPGDWPGRIIPEFTRSRVVCYVIGMVSMAFAVYFSIKGPKPKPTKVEANPAA